MYCIEIFLFFKCNKRVRSVINKMCCFCWNIEWRCTKKKHAMCFWFGQIEAWSTLGLMTCYFFTWKLFYPVTSQLWNVSVEDIGLLLHTNARVTQKQPCIFRFETAIRFSQNKDVSQAFSSCSAFLGRRQSNMNFSGFWKREGAEKRKQLRKGALSHSENSGVTAERDSGVTAICFIFSLTGDWLLHCQQLVAVIDPELPVLRLLSV